MRFTLLSTAAMALVTCASAAPIAPRSSILLDWTKESAIKTINSLMGQLPMDAHIWKFDEDDGLVGVNFNLDMQELAKTGIVTLSQHKNAKINMNVTISGLD